MGQPELNTITLPDEDSCVAVAQKLVVAVLAHLPENRAFIIHLVGDLGAGKTTFARGMLRGAGIKGPIRSPTFTLVETYEIDATRFVHIDLYRIGDAADAAGLGLREYDCPGVVWLVEWPERAAIWPHVDIRVELAYRPSGRALRVLGQTPAGVKAVQSGLA